MLSQHKRLAFGGLAGLMVLALVGAAFLHAGAANAAHRQPTATSSQIISTGTRTDSTAFHAIYLGSRSAGSMGTGTFNQGHKQSVPRRTWRKSANLAVPSAHAPAPTGPLAPLPNNINNPETPLPAGTFQGQHENGFTPSDMGLGAGGGYIVQAINDGIDVWNTSGVQQSGWPKTAQAFFGLPGSTFIYDPRVVFDSISGHFFILFDEDNSTTGHLDSNYYLGVSATSNPTGTWHLYKVPTGENLTTANAAFADFPILGIDAQGLYFTGNHFFFTANGGNFADSFLDVTALSPLEAGSSSITIHQFSNMSTSSGQAFAIAPAVSYGYPRAEFMVDSDFDCTTTVCNTYDVWSVSNVITGTPRVTYVKITGPNWSQQPAANQPGTGGAQSIDASDPRVAAMPVYRDGQVYFAIGTGYNNGTTTVDAVQWIDLNVALDTGNAACGTVPNRCVDIIGASVRDTGLLGYSGSTDAFDPALSVTSDGDIVMTFTYSSLTLAPITAIYGHRSTVPFGSLGTGPHTVSASQSTHFYAETRWGDYSAVALDSSTCSSAGCFRLWFSGMYVRSDGTWGTTISSETYNVLQE